MVMGLSGSGKSTLLGCFQTYNTTAGRIFINGEDLLAMVIGVDRIAP